MYKINKFLYIYNLSRYPFNMKRMAASTPQALSVRAAAETLLEAINNSSSRC